MRISILPLFSAITRKWNAAAEEVIDRCWQLGDANPILFIHDVGAGGLSNAMPELVSDGGRGGGSNCATFLATSRA